MPEWYGVQVPSWYQVRRFGQTFVWYEPLLRGTQLDRVGTEIPELECGYFVGFLNYFTSSLEQWDWQSCTLMLCSWHLVRPEFCIPRLEATCTASQLLHLVQFLMCWPHLMMKLLVAAALTIETSLFLASVCPLPLCWKDQNRKDRGKEKSRNNATFY